MAQTRTEGGGLLLPLMDASRKAALPQSGLPEHSFRVGDRTVAGNVVTGSMLCGPWNRRADGSPAPESVGVLIDSVLGAAAMLERPAGSWAVTTELTMDFLRPLPEDGETVVARGEFSGWDDEGCFARGEVVGADGRVLTAVTTWLKFVPGVPETILNPAPLTSSPAPITDLDSFMGAEPVPEGTRFPHDHRYLNPLRALHGGVITSMAGLAAHLAVGQQADMDLQSLKLAFVRPGTGPAICETTTLHDGRSVKVAQLILRGADGKPATLGTATFRAR